MAFKPNYNQQRSERNRLKQQKREEKQQRREGKAAERKAARDEPSDAAADPQARDPGRRLPPRDSGFVLFDVVYEDGTLSANRTVPAAELDRPDGDASARAVIEAQDRKFAEISGKSRAPIKSIVRSAAR
jgi:hypothetical protein